MLLLPIRSTRMSLSARFSDQAQYLPVTYFEAVISCKHAWHCDDWKNAQAKTLVGKKARHGIDVKWNSEYWTDNSDTVPVTPLSIDLCSIETYNISGIHIEKTRTIIRHCVESDEAQSCRKCRNASIVWMAKVWDRWSVDGMEKWKEPEK